MNQRGFTLVELIIVSTLTVALGLIFSGSLVEIFKGENKSRIISQVRHDGQLILDKLAGEIRQSEKVICAGDAISQGDSLVLYKQGLYTRFRFVRPLPVGAPTANGFIAVDSWESPVDQSVACTLGAINPQVITDQDRIKGVSVDFSGDSSFYGGVEERIFKVQSQAGFNDIVLIKFKVFAGVLAGQAYDSTVEEGGITFSSSVQLRNYK